MSIDRGTWRKASPSNSEYHQFPSTEAITNPALAAKATRIDPMFPIKKSHSARTWHRTAITAALFLLLLLGGGGWACWNTRKAGRIDALLEAVVAAETVNAWATAEVHLRGCLEFRSEDAALCIRVGRDIENGAISDQDRRLHDRHKTEQNSLAFQSSILGSG